MLTSLVTWHTWNRVTDTHNSNAFHNIIRVLVIMLLCPPLPRCRSFSQWVEFLRPTHRYWSGETKLAKRTSNNNKLHVNIMLTNKIFTNAQKLTNNKNWKPGLKLQLQINSTSVLRCRFKKKRVMLFYNYRPIQLVQYELQQLSNSNSELHSHRLCQMYPKGLAIFIGLLRLFPFKARMAKCYIWYDTKQSMMQLSPRTHTHAHIHIWFTSTTVKAHNTLIYCKTIKKLCWKNSKTKIYNP